MRSQVRILLIAVSLAAACWAGGGNEARANGTSVTVVLKYMEEVSNFGPATAFGTAEILAKEGEVRVMARGLQFLPAQTYQLWLVNTATKKAFSGGRISADVQGNVNVTNVLPREIPDESYNLVFLSVEAADVVVSQPSQQRSIAGPMGPLPPTENRPDTGTTTTPPRQAPPPELPRTGGEELPATWNVIPHAAEPLDLSWRWALVAMVALGAGGIGFMAGRRMPARKVQL